MFLYFVNTFTYPNHCFNRTNIPGLPTKVVYSPKVAANNKRNNKMIKGNFLGAAIVAIIYTVYVLTNKSALPSKTALVLALVVLNALTIILMHFAFK